jgi:hypothetical protein
LVAGALIVGVSAGLPRHATAEEAAGPGAGTSQPQAAPRAVPKPLLPDGRGPAEDGDASRREAPSFGPGCPDQGRKLQLIV